MPSSAAQWQSDMETLQSQLQSSVNMQIQNTREGIKQLADSQDQVHNVRSYMSQVNELCQQSERLIDNFPFIKQVSRTFENFCITKRIYEEFCDLDAKVERTNALLQEDLQSEDPRNLLVVRYYLAQLEGFKTQTLTLMKDAPSATVYTLKRYFKKLDDLIATFDEFYWKMPRNLLLMASSGKQQLIVRVVKVLASMDKANRSRFTTILDDLVDGKFKNAHSTLEKPAKDDPELALKAADFFWESDLKLVRDNLTGCFPPDYAIMDFFVLTYHRHIHAVINDCTSGPPKSLAPADILLILGWVHNYYEKMSSEFGCRIDDLEPRLLDVREASLMAEYCATSRQKINEWLGNLFENEKRIFLERQNMPESGPNNRLLATSAADLIQIVKQHILAASTSNRGKLVADIIAESCRAVLTLQQNLLKLIEGERVKYLQNPESVAHFFEEYVIMIGNTALRWATNFSEQAKQISEELEPELVPVAAKHLQVASEGFISVARTTSQVLNDVIFKPVLPVVDELFTPSWYSDALVDTVMATFADYFTDYKEHCEDFLFSKLVVDVLDRFLIFYAERLRAKNTRLRLQECPEIFRKDLASIASFFKIHRDEKRVQKSVDPLDKLIALVTSSRKMIFLEFFAFWKSYPDMPLTFFEEVLQKRDDLDRVTIKEIMETCRKKTLEEKIMETQPSLFSRIKS